MIKVKAPILWRKKMNSHNLEQIIFKNGSTVQTENNDIIHLLELNYRNELETPPF